MPASLEEMTMRHEAIEIRKLTGALGAEIFGVDLRAPLEGECRAAVLDAFDRHLLICFRDQKVTPAEHMAFSDNFGPMMDLPHIPRVPGYALYHQVLREPTMPKSAIAGQNWHSDSTFLASPPWAIAMRAVEVPPAGGDTAFASLCLMYEGLSDKLKEVLSGLRAVHSARRIFGSQSTGAIPVRDGVDRARGDDEETHPVVCTHPATGRKGVFVNRVYTNRFEGMTPEESKPLLDYLYAQADRAEYQCRVRWQPDTMVVWNNRFLHHRAIVDYHERRELQRTTIAGPRPA
jgi:taurine dioxygenase